MNLDEAQRKKVAAWIEDGLKLAEIQGKLASEWGVQMTYMEVRFLVDDLKLMPKDPPPPPPPAATNLNPPSAIEGEGEAGFSEPAVPTEGAAPGGGGVSVTLDKVARPGAMISGNVTFSDGQSAAWHLDQLGRLGLVPTQTGYKPSAPDLQSFQMELQNELQKMGF